MREEVSLQVVRSDLWLGLDPRYGVVLMIPQTYLAMVSQGGAGLAMTRSASGQDVKSVFG